MAILNFPADPQQDDQYTGDNGTTYIYDGVKWIGRASGTAGTNSIQNSGFVVQVDGDGDLVTPTFTIPNTAGTSGQVLTWPGGGSTLTWATSSSTTNKLVNGVNEVVLGATGAVTLPTLTVPISDNATPSGTGQTLKFSDSSQQAIIFGPASTALSPSAERIIIQGAPGYTGTTGEGGDVYLWAGPGGSLNGNGGDIKVRAGYGPGTGGGGYLNFQAGDSGTGSGGYINIESGNSNTYGLGGDITIQAKRGGEVYIRTNSDGTGNEWLFGNDGKLTLPAVSEIKTKNIDGLVNQSIRLGGGDDYISLSNYTAPVLGQSFTTADWATATWNGTSVSITGSAGFVTYINTIPTSPVLRINGSIWTETGGRSSGGDFVTFNNLPITTPTPVTITQLDVYTRTDASVAVQGDTVAIYAPNDNFWTFDGNGTMKDAGGSFIKTTTNNLVTTVLTQIVWTATETFISGAKLTIQVEAEETSGTGDWETQVCEAIVAVRGWTTTSVPVISVYGVTHTSVAPLMTFTVDRNPVSNLIEIVGTRTATARTTGNASLRIYSVETGTMV
jgi:hypothetical protein